MPKAQRTQKLHRPRALIKPGRQPNRILKSNPRSLDAQSRVINSIELFQTRTQSWHPTRPLPNPNRPIMDPFRVAPKQHWSQEVAVQVHGQSLVNACDEHNRRLAYHHSHFDEWPVRERLFCQVMIRTSTEGEIA
jgi:hypothetical protein